MGDIYWQTVCEMVVISTHANHPNTFRVNIRLRKQNSNTVVSCNFFKRCIRSTDWTKLTAIKYFQDLLLYNWVVHTNDWYEKKYQINFDYQFQLKQSSFIHFAKEYIKLFHKLKFEMDAIALNSNWSHSVRYETFQIGSNWVEWKTLSHPFQSIFIREMNSKLP